MNIRLTEELNLQRTIQDTVIFSILQALHHTKAKLLIVLSQKGKMARRFSKYFRFFKKNKNIFITINKLIILFTNK